MVGKKVASYPGCVAQEKSYLYISKKMIPTTTGQLQFEICIVVGRVPREAGRTV